MRTHPLSPKHRLQTSGFSLIEILVIVAIMALLMVMSAPTMNAAFKGSKLNQGVAEVSNFLHMAQQTAIKENLSVEVRFYKYDNPESNLRGNEEYQAFAMFVLRPTESGSAKNQDILPTQEGPLKKLPNSIYLVSNQEMSSLLGTNVFSGSQNGVRGIFTGKPITAEYRAFTFRPDGSASLPLDQKWFLTVLPGEAKLKGAEQRPANYACLTLNPTNGEIQTFTP